MTRLTPDEVLLGLLKDQPAHGYELLETFRDPAHLGHIWNMSTSQLYAVLKRLEEDGLISGAEIPQPNAPARTEYRLTDRGEARLERWLAEPRPPISIHRIRVQFLSRLYIAALLDRPAEAIIHRQLAACQKQLARTRAEKHRAVSPVKALTLDFVIGQLEACIAWLGHCQTQPLPNPARFAPIVKENNNQTKKNKETP
jgi:DNA-binding PadR family transcriptional regulator